MAADKHCCSGLDPTEDTESGNLQEEADDGVGVAVGSIRPRILKATQKTWRKAVTSSCSGLDPTEDTERSCVGSTDGATAPVAVGSIRPRILKVETKMTCQAFPYFVAVGSIRPRILKAHPRLPCFASPSELQWARSDRGY